MRPLDITEMGDLTKEEQHLSTMKGGMDRNAAGGFSLGDLNDRLNALEMLTNDRPLIAAEYQVAKTQVAAMDRVMLPSHRSALCLPAAISMDAPRSMGLLLLALFAALLLSTAAHAQVAMNATGNAPASNAMLDVSSTTKGLLAPRMTEAQRLNISTAGPLTVANFDGLLVYQTDSFPTEPAGYWYYDFSTPIAGWRHIAWGGKIWQLGGNAGTTTSDFLGTLNAQPLLFRTNAQEHGRITPTGELQLYPVSPAASGLATEKVEVAGAMKLKGGSAANTPGAIRFTKATATTPAKFEGYVTNSLLAGATHSDSAAVIGWKQLDNVLKERKNQESQLLTGGCGLPTYTTVVEPASPDRPWPITGPHNGNASGPDAPYYSFWEDSRRQYLYRAADLATLGICPGPSNPITAIAFNVSSIDYAGGWDLHFLRFSMKNTASTTVTAAYDLGSLTTFATPTTGPYAGWHIGGYHVVNGWNIHNWDQGGPGGFIWTGGNLLIDAGVDNQDWPARAGNVQSYPSGYQSMVSKFCDACGGNGTPGYCTWTTFPTTPLDGTPTAGMGSNQAGWGWKGGWTIDGSTNTVTCDGTFAYSGGGASSVTNKLPRVAFYCKYTGGGAAYAVGNYIYAQEGVMIGDAAWAATGPYPNVKFHGPGTISAQKSVWTDASLLSDYVFDLYYDGKARPEDAGATDYHPTPLKDYPDYVERERHLPTIDGRDAWKKQGLFSVDKLSDQLWVTVEQQALYIKELNERMDALQQYLVEKKLRELETEKK